MPNKLRLTGILFAGIFLAGYAVNLFFNLTRGDALVKAFFHPFQIMLIASSALFVVSAFVEPLRWIQPTVFIVSSPLAIIDDAQNIYGLGFFIMGVLLLERAGFFQRRRGIKTAVALLYLLIIEIVAVTVSKRPLADAVSPTFYIFSFGLFLWFLYKDRLVLILKEPKQKISLTGKGLSPAEVSYVLESVRGKTTKEIAVDFELSESTIRNTLFRAYKKLGIEDKSGLAVFAERFEILD
jgi:DNA-binding CsgD family transcriptional regulator